MLATVDSGRVLKLDALLGLHCTSMVSQTFHTEYHLSKYLPFNILGLKAVKTKTKPGLNQNVVTKSKSGSFRVQPELDQVKFRFPTRDSNGFTKW